MEKETKAGRALLRSSFGSAQVLGGWGWPGAGHAPRSSGQAPWVLNLRPTVPAWESKGFGLTVLLPGRGPDLVCFAAHASRNTTWGVTQAGGKRSHSSLGSGSGEKSHGKPARANPKLLQLRDRQECCGSEPATLQSLQSFLVVAAVSLRLWSRKPSTERFSHLSGSCGLGDACRWILTLESGPRLLGYATLAGVREGCPPALEGKCLQNSFFGGWAESHIQKLGPMLGETADPMELEGRDGLEETGREMCKTLKEK